MQSRRILRSRTDRYLGGVASGLATYFGIDPVLVRIGFVVLAAFFHVFAILGYLALWLLLPSEDTLTTETGDLVRENWYEVQSTLEGYAERIRGLFNR